MNKKIKPSITKRIKKRGLMLMFILPIVGGGLPFITYIMDKVCFPHCSSYFDILVWLVIIFSGLAIMLPGLLFDVSVDGGINSVMIHAIFNAIIFFLFGFFIYKTLNDKKKKWIILTIFMSIFLILGAALLFFAVASLGV